MRTPNFNIFRLAIFASCIVAAVFIQDSRILARQELAEKPKSQAINLGTSYKLPSKVFSSTREINVWVPPAYKKTEENFSVLYLIDGGLDQDFHHITGLAQLATINWDYEHLIVVGIKTENRSWELTHEPKDQRYIDSWEKSGGSEAFTKHIRDEVIPFIKSKYRVGERRAVVGESLAGLFIAETFLKWPDTFTDYICVSPSLWWDDQRLAKAAPELLAAHKESKRKLYITMADEGGTMRAGLEKWTAALKDSPPAGLEWSFVDRSKSETHSTIYHGAVHDALKKLFDLPPYDYGESPWYLIEGAQPPAKDETK